MAQQSQPPQQQKLSEAPKKVNATPFFRALNFELFASQGNPVIRVITFVGTGAFLGLVGYFYYMERMNASAHRKDENKENERL
jgi:hypothetical protein